MAIVPITIGTAIAIITTIEATVTITMVTGGIVGIIMATAIIITTIIVAIIITTGTIEANTEFLGAGSTRGQRPLVTTLAICSCLFPVVISCRLCDARDAARDPENCG
jgi:hypothetical protein